MQEKITIIDAGLVCENGVPSYFEIEYSYPKWRGSEYQWTPEYCSVRVSLETCFDALNEGKWERWEDGSVRMEAEVWNSTELCFEMKNHVMPLRDWVERALFNEGFFSAARRILLHLNTFNHESNNEIL